MSNPTNSEAGADAPPSASTSGEGDISNDLSIDVGSVPESAASGSAAVADNAVADNAVADNAVADNAVADNAVADKADDAENVEAPTLAEVRRTDGATIALVAGLAVTELPKDLYIPPEALEVFLETFEGPLDLLLYLIRRQNLDILDVSVSEITTQYMGYIDLMTELQLELVGEYLVMAAMLAEIKSRMLLPRPESIVDDEDDPRAELIRRLQQYERFKTAAEHIDEMPRLDRDIRIARAERPTLTREKPEPDVDLKEMLVALGQIMRKADMFQKHAVQFEPLTVRERMSNVLVTLQDTTEFVPFAELFSLREGRIGVVVTFLAILELVKEHMLDFVQNEPFAPLYVRTAQGESDATTAEPKEATGEIDDAFVDPDFQLPARAPKSVEDDLSVPNFEFEIEADLAQSPQEDQLAQAEQAEQAGQAEQPAPAEQSEQDAAASSSQTDSSE